MRPDPDHVAALFARLQAVKRNPRQWADDLRKRELACDRLTNAQRGAWRDVIHGCGMPNGTAGTFTPIDPNCLPPAMRADAHTFIAEVEMA